MPPLESTQRLGIGTPCPEFALVDTVSGKTVRPGDFAGRPLLVAFICNHCPFVKHIRAELARLSREAAQRGYACVFLCSNDERTHPSDGPGPMRQEALDAGYACPYLHDATQETARAFDAACTPDFFLFDRGHRLAYAGQLDESRPNTGLPVTGADLRAAIDAVLAGRPCAQPQKRSIGCSIKWRA
ncbi:MAG: thioredoxin family protein [Phycisphaerales bacterium]